MLKFIDWDLNISSTSRTIRHVIRIKMQVYWSYYTQCLCVPTWSCKWHKSTRGLLVNLMVAIVTKKMAEKFVADKFDVFYVVCVWTHNAAVRFSSVYLELNHQCCSCTKSAGFSMVVKFVGISGTESYFWVNLQILTHVIFTVRSVAHLHKVHVAHILNHFILVFFSSYFPVLPAAYLLTLSGASPTKQ